ncbi:hypothetical protein NVP1278O_43 [Vibrio phage 1.278.O._10N.286.54.E8]|nr:hypothetical protein NVP1278O_43 [Vibrio phage 1.278.O._10N.286.54.E8]
MGTRSLTKVYDQFNGNLICTMFVHFDGYPTGVGADIKQCLYGAIVGNGFSGDEPDKFINRMGQVATYLVRNSRIKFEFTGDDTGNFIDYTYHLSFDDGRIRLDIDSYGSRIYSGLLDEFDAAKVEELESE